MAGSSNKKRFVAQKEITVPKGTVVELTQKQAEELGTAVKPDKLGLRNDLGMEIPQEDKVLPPEDEQEEE